MHQKVIPLKKWADSSVICRGKNGGVSQTDAEWNVCPVAMNHVETMKMKVYSDWTHRGVAVRSGRGEKQWADGSMQSDK